MAWWFLGFGWCNLWHPSTRRFGLEDSTWDWRSEDHRTAIREQHGTNCRFLTASHWTSVEKMEKEVQVCRLFNTTRLVSWRQSTRMCKPIYNKDNRKRLPRYIYPIYPYYFFVYPSIHPSIFLIQPNQVSLSIFSLNSLRIWPLVDFDTGGPFPGRYKWLGAVLGSDGCLYGIPYNSQKILKSPGGNVDMTPMNKFEGFCNPNYSGM